MTNLAKRLTGKPEKFALAIVDGMNQSAAHRHAYDTENMLPATIHDQHRPNK